MWSPRLYNIKPYERRVQSEFLMYTEPDLQGSAAEGLSEEEEEDGEFLEDAENLENEVPDMMSSITSSLYILRIFDEPDGSSVPGFEYPVASDMELD